MISPIEIFEKKYGKKQEAKSSLQWEKEFNIFVEGIITGIEYQKEEDGEDDLRKELLAIP